MNIIELSKRVLSGVHSILTEETFDNWTKTFPTRPGKYWFRYDMRVNADEVDVYMESDGILKGRIEGYGIYRIEELNGYWIRYDQYTPLY